MTIALLAAYIAGWVVAMFVAAAQLAQSERWKDGDKIEAFDMFVGAMLGWIWPAVVVFTGFAWIARTLTVRGRRVESAEVDASQEPAAVSGEPGDATK